MHPAVYMPTPLLTPFIRHYLIIESQDEKTNRIFPDTSLVMAFRYKGQVNNLPITAISGLRKSGRLINYARNTGNILVIFREASANAFIKEPLNELFEKSIALDNIDGYRNVADIEEQLAEARDNDQRISLIEQFLIPRLSNQRADKLILAAIDNIRLSKGGIKIKNLAASLYISQDAFEKRFRKVVGVSPKQFSYIIRMRAILNEGLNKQRLIETAYEAGYFDQAHFNKDFKSFTGLTPSAFLLSPVFW